MGKDIGFLEKMRKSAQSGVAHILLLIAALGVISFILVSSSAEFKTNLFARLFPKPASQATTTFLETFTGNPTTPLPFRPSNTWDVTIHRRDAWSDPNFLMPVDAHHGPGCEPPLVDPTLPFNQTTNPLVTHRINQYPQSVFNCKDHLMTAINEPGYALIYLTPNHMVDFSQGEAVVKWDMSTFRSADRDWVDLWVTPYEDNLQLALDDFLPDLNGEPKRGIHVRMENGGTVAEKTFFQVTVFRSGGGTSDVGGGNAGNYEDFLTAHPARRDTFELRISKTHIKFCLVSINTAPPQAVDQCWANGNISPLDWDKGVVQFGHHSYSPEKGGASNSGGSHSSANTWHWDNVSISPATPFTIIPADKQYVNSSTNPPEVNFSQPAPVNSHLRFAGRSNSSGGGMQVSFDKGATWQKALLQSQRKGGEGDELMDSYWTPIPAGTTSAWFKGVNGATYGTNMEWLAIDISIFSQTTATGGPVPTPTPTPSPTATSTPGPVATATPTPTPTPVPTPVPTSTPAPVSSPTPKPTPILTGPTLGYTLAGSSVDIGDSNYMTGSRFTMGLTNASISSMSVYVASPVDSAPNDQYQLAIYTDSNGTPGTLVASSGTGTLTGDAWNSLPVSATLSANTSYWLMYNSNGSSISVNNVGYDLGGLAAWGVQTFGSWPQTFGAASTSVSTLSIFASLGAAPTTPPSPTPTPFVDNIPPSVPTNLTGNAVSTSQVNLSWGASTDNVGVTGYDVFRNGNYLVTVTTTSFGDTDLTASTSYTYTVAARDAAGNTSAQSSPTSVTTQAPPVTNGAMIGTVVNSTTSAPLGFVRVSLLVNGVRRTAYTAFDGTYILTSLPPATYSVTYSKFHYNTQTINVTITSGQTTQVPTIRLVHR